MATTLSAPKINVYQVNMPLHKSPKEIDRFIHLHPLTAELRRNSRLAESRPHLSVPETRRSENLLTGVLLGSQKITIPPYCFKDDGKSMVMIMHLGGNVCSHDGVVHGGLLATILDECLVRCCSPAFENNIGVTASLNIEYRSPAKANAYIVLKAETIQVQGRKAWVDGRIETLPIHGEQATLIAEAKGFFVEPKQAQNMNSLYKDGSS